MHTVETQGDARGRAKRTVGFSASAGEAHLSTSTRCDESGEQTPQMLR